ncbi:MAG: nitrogen fixation protein NifQ [Helicobacteraceae bacterium]|jgi:nitrogen fixation protein NifQ|nr:nitrogen fixation protein NifQ [Helicobacteraceae bacterium]
MLCQPTDANASNACKEPPFEKLALKEPTLTDRASIVSGLLSRSASVEALADPNRFALASLIAGRFLNEGALCASLGLDKTELDSMWDSYFYGERLELPDQEIDDLLERADLINTLLKHRAGKFHSEAWLASIVAQACAGKKHLWRDLGLANRAELSALLFNAFPAFASQNIGDMRWKKFLYRRYCADEGIYVCPSPSCAECSDYSYCFAPEL